MSEQGWIEHDGNGMPVAPETMVLVKFRDGSPYYMIEGSERPAGRWDNDIQAFSSWHSQGNYSDIVAYRIITNPETLTPPR